MAGEQRQRAIERAVVKGDSLPVADRELSPFVAVPGLSKGDICGGRIESDDADGWRRGDRCGDRSGAGADVEQGVAVTYPSEAHQQSRELAAPAAHEPLVGGGSREQISCAHTCD